MAARCPNPGCGNVIERDESGKYPSVCPRCGLELRRKRSSGGQSPEPEGAARTADQPEPFGRQGNPFGASSKSKSKRSDLDFLGSGSKREPSFLQPAPPKKQAPPSRAEESPKPTVTSDPFAGSAGPRRKVSPLPARPAKTESRSSLTWIMVGVAGVVGLGGVYFFLSPSARTRSAGGGVPFENIERNYRIQTPGGEWKQTPYGGPGEIFELAFHRKDRGGWIAVASAPPNSTVPRPQDLSAKLIQEWQKLRGFDRVDGAEEAELAGQPAYKVRATFSHGRREAYVMFAYGLTYRLVFEAPAEQFPALAADFEAARRSFALREQLKGWENFTVASTSSGPAVFPSSRHPYRLTCPDAGWREDPEMQGVSLWADLKLASPTLNASVVVSVRPFGSDQIEDPMERWKDLYPDLLRRRYEGGNVTAGRQTPINIRGHEGLQTEFQVTAASGSSFLVTAYIVSNAKDAVYRIECQAPSDQASYYKPVFQSMIDSFEILDHVPGKPSPDLVATTSGAGAPIRIGPASEPAVLPKAEAPMPPADVAPPIKTPPAKPIAPVVADQPHGNPEAVDLARFFEEDGPEMALAVIPSPGPAAPPSNGPAEAAPAQPAAAENGPHGRPEDVDVSKFFQEDDAPGSAPASGFSASTPPAPSTKRRPLDEID